MRRNFTLTALFVMVFLFSCGFVSAVDTHPLDAALDISHPLRSDGAVDNNIEANITVRGVDQTVIAFGIMSLNDVTQEHNFTLDKNNNSKTGFYQYCITATNGTLSDTSCFNYEVTITGERTDIAKSMFYILIGGILMIFFLLSLYGSVKIPFKNTKNSNGRLVSINDLKYLKLFLWFCTYILLVFISFAFAWASRSTNWEVGYRILHVIYSFGLAFMLPIFILLMVFAFVNVITDGKIVKEFERNVKPR